ncbi:TetR family transcriptional regulator [Sphingomonas sp. AOB5]|uniref:TetR family transcriptional regulator n=1 Tax=Sphingomonas sp. AOB5 TaxID=3034017 RepID=UPI0023F76520|nr:TetR family transcriptional regulator [Sphingomonas sp. AOB5]MDF7776102.1 TetR family transcriptional regulator [Sphingomonas sp. AOB5]
MAGTADRLLDATSALMIDRNSVDISFSDIAAKSGVNAALIRYHFGSKNGMFMALLERDAGGTFDELEQLIRADMGAAQKLRHHVHGIIKVYFRFPYMNRLAAALAIDADSETARFLSERFTRPLAAAQRAILEQGVAEGVFRPVDPMFFHFSLIGACEHLFVARHSLHYAFGIDEIDDALRRGYAGHVTDMLMRSVLMVPER